MNIEKLYELTHHIDSIKHKYRFMDVQISGDDIICSYDWQKLQEEVSETFFQFSKREGVEIEVSVIDSKHILKLKGLSNV